MKKRIDIGESFTFIEMLVVIAVIIILFMLIMPVVGDIKERGRMVRCKNNLKELHIACITYSINNGGYLPNSASWETCSRTAPGSWDYYQAGWGWVDWTYYQPHNAGDSTTWRPGVTWWWGTNALTSITNGSLFQYAGNNAKIYVCPSFNRQTVAGTRAPHTGAIYPLIYPGEEKWGDISCQQGRTSAVYRCYSMNQEVGGARLEYTEGSKTLLFAEQSFTNYFRDKQGVNRKVASWALNSTDNYTTYLERWNLAWDGSLIGTNYPSTNSRSPCETIGFWHNGKGSFIFVDGHVDTVDFNIAADIFKMTNGWLHQICKGKL